MAKANRSFKNDEHAESAMSDIAVAGILVVLAFVIVLSFLPILNSTIATAKDDPNGTANQDTLLDLIPFVIVAALLLGAVVFLVRGVQKLRD